MRRQVPLPLVLAAVLVAALVGPATVAAAAPWQQPEVVTFVSRAELIRQGLLKPMTSTSTPSVSAQALCLWDCIYVTNKRYLRSVKPFVTMVQGNGPTTMSIDITRSVKNSFSATAGVGFNVERTESVTYRSSTSVPNGACWTLRAYNVFYAYAFEVWQEPFVG